MGWLEVEFCFEPKDDQLELLVDRLAPFAEAESVIVERLGDPDDLDPNALLPETRVKLYREEGQARAEWRQQLKEIAHEFNCNPPTFTLLADENWQEAWKENFHPLEIGSKFLICPAWEEAGATNRISILIEPGAAFGTGLHETTQLCLEGLESLKLDQRRVLDLGAGSGILSIGAAKLGAKSIVAVEIDSDACKNMQTNLNLNQIDTTTIATVKVICGTVADVPTGDFDLILANIIAAILMPIIEDHKLIDRLAPNAESRIIFSGVINSQRDEFSKIIDQNGGMIETITQKGEWLSFCVRRRDAANLQEEFN